MTTIISSEIGQRPVTQDGRTTVICIRLFFGLAFVCHMIAQRKNAIYVTSTCRVFSS